MMMRFFCFSILFLSCSAQQEHLTCLRTSEAFQRSSSQPPQDNIVSPQGRPGKIGPKGIKGDPGAKGETGGINNESIDAVLERITSLETKLSINTTTENRTAELERRIQQLEERVGTFEALTQRISALEKKELPSVAASTTITTVSTRGRTQRESCVRGVVWENQCIRLPYTSATSTSVSFSQAAEICRRTNCHIAEITSDHMYDTIVDYVRSTWNFSESGSIYVDVWLGSFFDTPSKNPYHLIRLTTGRRIILTRWHPGYPLTSSTYTNLILRVRSNEENTDQGIWNYVPSTNVHAPLCAYNI